jgi:hypothetical protein
LARFLNCDSVATTATAFRSQMLFTKYGLVALYSIAYAEYFDENGAPKTNTDIEFFYSFKLVLKNHKYLCSLAVPLFKLKSRLLPNSN